MHLRKPSTIRRRCHHVLEWVIGDHSQFFRVQLDKLGSVADYVSDETRMNYPSLDVPFHARRQHFFAGAHDRLAALRAKTPGMSAKDFARQEMELTIVSVLLDAGAGTSWKYKEKSTGETFGRSEGLAVASFDLFCAGLLSSDPNKPSQVDKKGLKDFSVGTFSKAFQVSESNPIVAAESRVKLLNSLGDCIQFSQGDRLGYFYDHIIKDKKEIKASDILAAVLETFGAIWPGRIELAEQNLGDVWHHPAIGGTGPSANLIGFHKLSQWLSYSLIEPIQDSDVKVHDIDDLTGLPEYRNGGLMLDLGLLELKDPDLANKSWPADSELIVEWRALTLALLDLLHEPVCDRLRVDSDNFPLTKVLQGGTWSAGRKIAAKKRADASPPLKIASDGTVF